MKLKYRHLVILIFLFSLLFGGIIYWFFLKQSPRQLTIIDDKNQFLKLNLIIYTNKNTPQNAILVGNKIYVATKQGKIQVYDFGGKVIKEIGENILKYPVGLAWTDEQLIVSDNWLKQVYVFNEEGKLLRSFGKGVLSGPAGIAIKDNKIWVADAGGHSILCFDWNGKLLVRYGSGQRTVTINGFAYPNGVLPVEDGFLVADTLNNRLSVWKKDKPFLVWDSPAENQPAGPRALVKGTDGNIWILCNLSANLLVLNTDNWQVKITGEFGDGNFQWKFPTGLTADNSGHLVVTDAGNQRVIIYTIK
ncbi:NHL repeat-containing protein [Carboxydocella sporoproducens DSM 16521]|uniref:NHL repeat-containing protein n=2 Tax=Carboxydocella TaxID=178898 RepID=A0A1T4MM70_9FIRM|nr:MULTISPECIES: hypothetical protein [Carboxydocella]AVX21383.1 NHL repeat-containing protein [Carboxydocella thermautotrophica]SJZ67885.1 NHL repeat-containing protein [Carboxydocella sporoproducens DSM 16521]